MAEGFEHYHIPQQSRRDKLRILGQTPTGFVESSHNTLHPGCAALPSLYDPSLISSDLLACANQQGHGFHSNHNNVNVNPLSATNNEPCKGGSVKEEGSNLMMRFAGTVGGVVNGSSSSSTSSVSHHHAYLDPESSLHMSPGAAGAAIQVINSNPFLYQPQSLQNLREFDQSYNNGSEIMVFKPEPLSLSLSSHNSTHHEMNLQRYGSVIYSDKVGGGGGGCVVPGLVGGGSGSSASNEVSRNSVPLGPFTGYASVLKGSRFLKPAQQLLEELCDVGIRGVYGEKITADASLMETPSESLSASGIGVDDPLIGDGNHEGSKKKSRLLTMLDEVYRRYRQYYQQIHAVVTSFEYVAGLGNAAPYASLAINAMSKHFRYLKNAITDQLQFISKAHFQISNNRKDESPRFHNTDRGPYSQRPGFLEHQQPVWRPQRGLPERAVSVLRAWLFEHFLHPYPTDTDKLMLAKQTGLSRNQVSNWFINARVRLWKPMVEEIHMLESQQAQKKSQREEHGRNNLSDHLPSDNIPENPSTTMDKFQDVTYRRSRNELPNMQARNQEQQLNQQTNTSNQQVSAVGVSMGNGANNGVSLTLGLHQNHGIGLSEPFGMSAAHRFGLALQPHEGYVTSGFESQNRHFGRDVIGGQLLHDFVG